MSALFAVCSGAVLLVWPALFNGYPLVFSDTGGLVEMGSEPYMGWDKPWIYAPFLAWLHLGTTLWLPLAAQAVLVSWVLWTVQAVVNRPMPVIHVAVCLVLAAGSAAPWFTSLLMPDLFAPVAALSIFVLAFGHERLSKVELTVVAALGSIAISAHLAHLVVAAACIAAAVLFRWRLDRWRAAKRALTPLGLALAMLLLSNAVGHRLLAISPYGSVFALARLVGDGPGRAYIDRVCPNPGLRLCAWQGRLSADSDEFLWRPDGPMWADHFSPVRFAPEAARLVPLIVAAYPWQTLQAGAANTLRQLGLVRVGDTLVADHLDIAVLPRLRPYLPAAEIARYQAARQPRGLLRDAAAPFRWLHAGLLIAGALATVWIAALSWRTDPAVAGLAVLAVTALVANAFATGALSGPHDRYQARIAWLVLLAPLFHAARAATSAGFMRTRLS